MIILIIAHTLLQASVDISVTLTTIGSSTLKEGSSRYYFNEESSQAACKQKTPQVQPSKDVLVSGGKTPQPGVP